MGDAMKRSAEGRIPVIKRGQARGTDIEESVMIRWSAILLLLAVAVSTSACVVEPYPYGGGWGCHRYHCR